MKKLIVIVFLLVGSVAHSQTQTKGRLEDPTGEVRLNFLNTILLGSIELGYEHFIKNDQSIAVEFHFNDRFSYQSSKNGVDFNATAVLLSYNFYFAENETGSMYISPFFKYRFGDVTEDIDNVVTTTNLNSGYLGLIAGYRWNYNNFAFGPFGSIARGFSDVVAEKYSPVEFKAGFNVGYRF
ncbi:DUF3575 domain-containing protein [Shivajiella indica]|uniref:DUF3575 domain-containing protein n=1 Tax=Shivajiella indica TaxID=872115 RepID=A0ABW5B9A8_9BACT